MLKELINAESFWAAAYMIALSFLIGIAAGSFLNCAAGRSAKGESFLRGRSRCVSCGHTLKARDLVPLFSYIFQRGRCRYCGVKLSARYPLTELVMGLLSVAVLLRFDITAAALRNWLFICVLFVVTLVDLDTLEIPDACHIIGIGVWFIFVWLLPEPLQSLKRGLIFGIIFGAGLLLLSLLMDKLLGKESMGGGDIKLIFVCALYLGGSGTLFMLIIACIVGIALSRLQSRDGEGHFAFGPAIAIAAAMMLFFGEYITNAYTSLF